MHSVWSITRWRDGDWEDREDWEDWCLGGLLDDDPRLPFGDQPVLFVEEGDDIGLEDAAGPGDGYLPAKDNFLFSLVDRRGVGGQSRPAERPRDMSTQEGLAVGAVDVQPVPRDGPLACPDPRGGERPRIAAQIGTEGVARRHSRGDGQLHLPGGRQAVRR